MRRSFSPDGPDNLVIRAAELFSRTTGQKVDVTIQLRKKIPHGAGLGGGSSDAAATLLGLNRFYQTNLALAELARLAAEIGSDVPFFLFQSAAICRGRGEMCGTDQAGRNAVFFAPQTILRSADSVGVFPLEGFKTGSGSDL